VCVREKGRRGRNRVVKEEAEAERKRREEKLNSLVRTHLCLSYDRCLLSSLSLSLSIYLISLFFSFPFSPCMHISIYSYLFTSSLSLSSLFHKGNPGKCGLNLLLPIVGKALNLGSKNTYQAKAGDRLRIITPGGERKLEERRESKGRRKKEEGRRKKEEGRRKKRERERRRGNDIDLIFSLPFASFSLLFSSLLSSPHRCTNRSSLIVWVGVSTTSIDYRSRLNHLLSVL